MALASGSQYPFLLLKSNFNVYHRQTKLCADKISDHCSFIHSGQSQLLGCVYSITEGDEEMTERTLMPASRRASASPIRASRFTCAVRDIPRARR